MKTNGRLPRPSTPKPPGERRARRAAVEAALSEGQPMGQILAELSARFEVSRRTIRSDARKVEARWASELAPTLAGKRAATIRRAERLAERAETEGDLGTAVRATGLLARILGLGVVGSAPGSEAEKPPMTLVDLVAMVAARED